MDPRRSLSSKVADMWNGMPWPMSRYTNSMITTWSAISMLIGISFIKSTTPPAKPS